jgi:seryl-tRNA synthetase
VIDPTLVKNVPRTLKAACVRGVWNPSADLAELAVVEAERRRLIPLVETLKRDQNAAGDAVAKAKREGLDPSAIFAENKARSARIRELEGELAAIEQRRDTTLLVLPNLPHDSVPVGKSAADNVEVRRWGTPPAFDFEPKPHWELGPALGILDFERAAKDVRRPILGACSAPAHASSARSSTSCSISTRASMATRKRNRRSW